MPSCAMYGNHMKGTDKDDRLPGLGRLPAPEGPRPQAMIVADTGAIVAIIDRSDRHHRALTDRYRRDPGRWVLPWAILPEVHYLIASVRRPARGGGLPPDLADGAFQVEWGRDADPMRAHALSAQRLARSERCPTPVIGLNQRRRGKRRKTPSDAQGSGLHGTGHRRAPHVAGASQGLHGHGKGGCRATGACSTNTGCEHPGRRWRVRSMPSSLACTGARSGRPSQPTMRNPAVAKCESNANARRMRR